MGCLPIQMTAKSQTVMSRTCLEQENKDSVLYNQKLEKQLPQIEASLRGSKLLYANVYDPVMDMIKNPSKYGIYNIFLVSQVMNLVLLIYTNTHRRTNEKQDSRRRRKDVVEQDTWKWASCAIAFQRLVQIIQITCFGTLFIHPKLLTIT